MHSFTDSKGREWPIAITIGAIKRVKDATGVNLLTPELPRKECEMTLRGTKKAPLATELHFNLELLAEVIYQLYKPVADERKISDDEFCDSMSGLSMKAAKDAFMEEWADFSRDSGRPELEKVIRSQQKMVHVEAEKDAVLLDQAVEAVERMAQKRRNRIAQRLDSIGRSNSSINSPELSESTPSH